MIDWEETWGVDPSFTAFLRATESWKWKPVNTQGAKTKATT